VHVLKLEGFPYGVLLSIQNYCDLITYLQVTETVPQFTIFYHKNVMVSLRENLVNFALKTVSTFNYVTCTQHIVIDYSNVTSFV